MEKQVYVNTAMGRIKLSDDMIANPDEFEFYDKLYAIGHEFGCLAIVYANCEQDSIDEAINNDMLDCLQIPDDEYAAMSESEQDECLHGGNASEPFDQTYMWIVELPNPAFSLVACMIADGLTTE